MKFDPRTKLFLLLGCAIITTLAAEISYLSILIIVIAIIAALNGEIKISLIFSVIYFFLMYIWTYHIVLIDNPLSTMFSAWMTLVYKVYPSTMMALIMIKTTKVSEFISAMRKLRLPDSFIITFAMMLRYIPTLKENWDYIKDSMKLRGIRPSLIGFFKSPSLFIECLYTPLLISASNAIDELTIAAVTRGIENPGEKTSLIQIKFRMADYLVLLAESIFIFYIIVR
jgi:hypothetical protein